MHTAKICWNSPMQAFLTRFLLPLGTQSSSNNPTLPTIYFQQQSATFSSQTKTGGRWQWQRLQVDQRWSNHGICWRWNWGIWWSCSNQRTWDKQSNNWWAMKLESIFYSISTDAQWATKKMTLLWNKFQIHKPQMLRARNPIHCFDQFFYGDTSCCKSSLQQIWHWRKST